MELCLTDDMPAPTFGAQCNYLYDTALALFGEPGKDSVRYLNPLPASIDPRESWRMLRLFEDKVLPYLPR